MDEDIQYFIENVADTFVKKDLIVFLHDNPSIDDCKGLAVRINRDAEQIASEIQSLVAAGIVRQGGQGAEAVYWYNPSPEQREIVERFVRYYREHPAAVEDELLRRQVEQARRAGLREVQRERTKTKAILTSMADGVLVTDSEGAVVLYNPPFALMLGLEGEDCLGRKLRDCITSGPLLRLVERIEQLPHSPYTMVAEELELTQPKRIVLKAHISPVREDNGDIIGVVTVLRDITEIRDKDRERMDFIYMVSHELRSPLTSIKGFLVSLLRGVFGELTREQVEPLKIIEDQSNRLLSLINDLLDLARLDIGQRVQQMELVQLQELLWGTVKMFEAQAREKNIALHLDVPYHLPAIEADPDNMEHVFVNLISNAIKYTLPNGKVTVRAESTGSHVRVSVSDTGIGIPEESLPRIFDRFYRVKDPRTRDVMGTGLGLAIVKNIVEAHLGVIEVTSRVGEGTTFTVTLPQRHTSGGPLSPPPLPEPEAIGA
ncbi:MAG: cell wall metabolism sensor histidine kinase WalK [Abditibacteriales bacterium]|nr:cell wall metabolism sensor histidine kinase WalK [Abditibacteriales bacterium]MDW8364343.1 ATP-binding protein [Abditibacteriales bacterium]